MHFERDGGRPYCSVSFVLGVLRSWVSRHIWQQLTPSPSIPSSWTVLEMPEIPSYCLDLTQSSTPAVAAPLSASYYICSSASGMCQLVSQPHLPRPPTPTPTWNLLVNCKFPRRRTGDL
jgi:hypothetical protein